MKILAFLVLAFSFHVSHAGNSDEYNFLLKETQKASEITPEEYKKIITPYQESMLDKNTAPIDSVQKVRDAQKRVELSNEDFTVNLERTLFLRLRNTIETQNADNIKDAIVGDIKFSDLNGSIAAAKPRTIDGISFFTVDDMKIKSGKDDFMKDFKNYLASFKKVEYVDAKVLGADGVFFDKTNLYQKALMVSSDVIHVELSLEIRGIKQDGFRRVDKARVTVMVANLPGNYMIRDFKYDNFQSLYLNREPSFKQVASNAGFDAGKVYPRLEALRRGGYAFAVEDFNNDGNLDAFVGAYGESTLWLGHPDGTFTEFKMPDINKVTLAKAAAFVDLDNDGWKDLIITRFAADSQTGDVLIFKNDHGTFKEVKNAFKSDILRDYAMPMAIADFNNDGLLDVYIGFPGERDFSAGKAPVKEGFSPHGLFLNQGGFKFKDATSRIGSKNTPVMPHGALASDYNHDGHMDILIMDDQKNLSPIYENGANGFELKNSDIAFTNYGYGMGISAGDFNQDGTQDYIISNATFTAQNRLAEKVLHMSGPLDAKVPPPAAGLRMFINNPKTHTFTESHNPVFADAGEGAGGVSVIDYDNDGLQDIYLVNGLWSGSSRDDSIDSLFAKATDIGLVNLNHLQDGAGDRSHRGSTRSIFMNVLMKDHVGTGKDEKTLSFGGYQRNRLFKNLGNGEFIEVGYLEGVDSESDGYMSVVADINHDGKPDLLLRNCDPGAADHPYMPIEVFQNNHEKNKSVIISLKGKKSNAMGIGAKLYATIGDKTYYREMLANNSAAQGEVMAHFGLGTYDKISKLKVIWPSGLIDTFRNLKPGKQILQETVNSVALAH